MKLRQPPKWATSLLRRFGRSLNNEAIIGDLTECFQRGKTAAWYWKQVLIAIVVGVSNDPYGAKSSGFRALTSGWIVFATLFITLFPILGRCTVLVCIAGVGSGLVVAALSRHWLYVLFYSVTVQLYWIGLGTVSSPYSPLVWLYKTIGLELARSAEVSTNVFVGNLVVLTLAIWFGGVWGYCNRLVTRGAALPSR